MILKAFLPLLFGALLWPNHLATNSKIEKHPDFIQTNTKYMTEDGKISITMPSEYTVSESEDGLVKTTKVSSVIGEVTYFFGWTLHEGTVSDRMMLAEVSLESFVESAEAEILEQRVYKYGKNKGIDATVTLMDGAVNCFYRVIIIDNYQFQMVVVTEEAELNKAEKKFLNSFKYKSKG
ncbi:hypothetical protein ACV07N_14140 [Roseivirga echinicomitans]